MKHNNTKKRGMNMNKTNKELLKLELIRQFDSNLALSDWMRVFRPVRLLYPSANNPDNYLESRKFIHTELGVGIKVNTLRNPFKFELTFEDLNPETKDTYAYALDISNETELYEEFHWTEECYVGRSRLGYYLSKKYLTFTETNRYQIERDEELRYVEINSDGVLDMNVELESFLNEVRELKHLENRVYLALEINMDDVSALDDIEWTEKADKSKIQRLKEALTEVANSNRELSQFEDIIIRMVEIFKTE